MDPLISDAALSAFPGAPFAPSLVAAAASELRSEAGWHIAPRVTQTRVLWCEGGPVFKLPTLLLDADQPVTVSHQGRVFEPDMAHPDGLLFRAGGWPWGRVSVTFTHGYEACPAELLPILAEKALGFGRDSSVKRETIMSRSVDLGSPASEGSSAVIDRYRL